MAFFTDMMRSLTETGNQVAQKTKDFSDILQLKAQISKEKETISRQYTQIGKKVFESADAKTEVLYETEFSLIKQSLETLASLESKLADLEGSIHCPDCGAKVTKGSLFCSQCGAKIPVSVQEADEPDVIDTAAFSEDTADSEHTKAAVPAEEVTAPKEDVSESPVTVTEDSQV